MPLYIWNYLDTQFSMEVKFSAVADDEASARKLLVEKLKNTEISSGDVDWFRADVLKYLQYPPSKIDYQPTSLKKGEAFIVFEHE